MKFCVRERFFTLIKNYIPKIISSDRNVCEINLKIKFNSLYLFDQADSDKMNSFDFKNLRLKYPYAVTDFIGSLKLHISKNILLTCKSNIWNAHTLKGIPIKHIVGLLMWIMCLYKGWM